IGFENIEHRQDELARVRDVAAGQAQQLVDGDDEPERGVDRVVLGRLLVLGKPVGNHALRDVLGPLGQDALGDIESASCKTETTYRDTGVPTPVAEPG